MPTAAVVSRALVKSYFGRDSKSKTVACSTLVRTSPSDSVAIVCTRHIILPVAGRKSASSGQPVRRAMVGFVDRPADVKLAGDRHVLSAAY